MVHLVALLDAPEDGDGVLHRGLLHHHGLEPPLQCRVLFDILPVFVQCSRADAVQLSPGQHGLQHVPGIQSPVGLARAHDGVQLVDEEDDLAVAVLHVLQHGLQALLELAPVFGPCHQRAHVQGEYLLVLQALGHVPAHNPLGQALHHGGLAHAGLADQHRVVLGLPGQDADDIADLRVPADDRVKLLVPGLLHQLLAVFLQGVIGGLRVVAGDPLVPPDGGQGPEEAFPGDAVLLPDLGDLPVGVLDHGQEEVLHGHILVSQLLRLVLGVYQHLVQVCPHIYLAALNLGALRDRLLHPVHEVLLLDLHLLYQLQNQAVLHLQQAVEQMLLFDFLVSVFVS